MRAQTDADVRRARDEDPEAAERPKSDMNDY
jgi:hypothetical protein